jgi:hypothetical protein
MGFMDKLKGAFNIGGVKVKITNVESPFPIQDSVIKGNFEMVSGADHEILSATTKFIAERKVEDDEGKESTEELVLGQNVSDKDHEVIGRPFQYPCTIKKDETKQDGFCLVMDRSVDEALSREGWSYIGTKFFICVEADVKGTPFDANDKLEVRVVR